MTKQVLIVGGTGLVGRPTVERLISEGYSVTCVTRRPEVVRKQVHLIVADVNEPGWETLIDVDRYSGCDLIYLAYQASNDPIADRRVNYDALVASVNRLSPRKVVYASSVSVFGNSPESDLVTESSPRLSQTEYARDKIDAEKFLQTISARTVVLYLTIVYGDGDPRLAFYRKLLASAYFVYRSGGNGIYNVVHAEDAAAAVVAALNSEDLAHHEQLIVNGEEVLAREWFSWIEKTAGFDKKPRAPKWIAPVTRGAVRALIGRLGVRVPARVSEPKATQFERRLQFDATRARSVLGWRAIHSIRKG